MLTVPEIEEAINWSIDKRQTNHPARINNNYKKQIVSTTLKDIVEYINDRKPIITHYGVMFSRHGTVPNPTIEMVKKFLDNRSIHKKQMFQFEKGSEDFERYNLLQLLDKIDANAFYGALGKFSCIYYNLHVATSITTEGRNLISSATLLFESFLNNNVPFSSLNEVITFINHVITEERYFSDYEILDGDVSIDDTFYHVVKSIGFGYLPDEKDLQIIWDILSGLSPTDLNRLYYKNNLFAFIERNSKVLKSILYILQKLDAPFVNPNKVPDEIKEELKVFSNLLREYVYYDHQHIDRTEKMESLIRSVALINDTDSCILSLDGWYRFILDKVLNSGLEYPIMEMELNMDTDEISKVYTKDYDFEHDEIIEIDRAVTPNKIVPQDNLKYSIINIICYVITEITNDFMIKYSMNSNSYNPENHSCFMYMKTEFLFKKLLLLENAKKNYATYQLMQEGNVVPADKALDIKGIPCFVKTTTNASTREQLKNILLEDILNSDEIDQVKVLKDIAIVEKGIFDSIQNGEKKFYKPARIKSLAAYDDPMRIQGIKSSLAYNTIKDDSMSTINLEQRNTIDIIKTNITLKNVDAIKETYPEVYMKMVNLMGTKDFAGSIDAMALPESEEVPKWILPFVDYKSIINDCVSLFPLESIGIFRGNMNNNYSNIIHV